MEPLVLTFAEIGFLLRSNPPEHIPVQERLRIETPADAVVAAGLSSLMARRLCVMDGDEVRPGPEVMAVAGGMSTAMIAVRVFGRVGGRPVLVYVFRGPVATLAVSPAEYGQFSVELLDQSVELVDQVVRFLDAAIVPGEESVVLLEASGERDFSVAIARDEDDAWFLSDSVASPDRGSPSSREAVVARLAELFGSRSTTLVS